MPDSPGKKKSSLLPNRPDTKALNKLLTNLSSAEMDKSPTKALKSRKSNSPTAKKFTNTSSQNTLFRWISKSKIDSLKVSKNKNTAKESTKPLKIAATKLENNPYRLRSKKYENNDKERASSLSENDDITTKSSSKPKLKRFNSGSSDELPTFKGKTSRKRPKQTESFKKYGVIVPSLDEILACQKKLSSYKEQVAEAQNLKEPSFKMPLSPQKSNQCQEQLLRDCKQLTLEEITKYFDDNIVFLQDIISGKNISDRHRRYVDKKRVDNFTTRDLTYNTSTIVFTFEQLDHIILLMQKQFDPEDKKTDYFFKVLMPELCLKIFMETHNMNKREANAYLGDRPID